MAVSQKHVIFLLSLLLVMKMYSAHMHYRYLNMNMVKECIIQPSTLLRQYQYAIIMHNQIPDAAKLNRMNTTVWLHTNTASMQ